MGLPLSVLELAGIAPGRSAEEALSVASTAEECGYGRIWFAGHPTTPRAVALIAHVAAGTTRLRIGSAGALLPQAAAEQFAALRALHGDRIDLGVGRESGGTSPRDELPAGVHILGTDEDDAAVAAERGLPFVFCLHLGRAKCDPAALRRYRTEFVPEHGTQPYVMASVNVLCANTDDEAERLASDVAENAVRGQGDLPDTQIPYLARKALTDASVEYGGPDTVRRRLDELAAEFHLDEVLVTPYDQSSAERSRTLRLVSPPAVVSPGP